MKSARHRRKRRQAVTLCFREPLIDQALYRSLNMFIFLPVLLVVLAILIAAVIVVQDAAPLGTHPYRWGLFLGITTAA